MNSNQSQSQTLEPRLEQNHKQGQEQNQPSNEADEKLLLEAVNRLKVAFPDNSREFYILLYNRLKECHFTRFMLVKKVNKVIDTYPYARLTIGAVINQDINK